MPGELEKGIWTHDDFERMGWHDSSIYACGAIPEDFELMFDLDYIVEWVPPGADEKYYSFWVAPATLVFQNVADVQVTLESMQGEITLLGLQRGDPHPTPAGRLNDYRWTLDGNEGSITFRATGFRQYFRAAPVLTTAQRLSQSARGGLSFNRTELAPSQLRPS